MCTWKSKYSETEQQSFKTFDKQTVTYGRSIVLLQGWRGRIHEGCVGEEGISKKENKNTRVKKVASAGKKTWGNKKRDQKEKEGRKKVDEKKLL